MRRYVTLDDVKFGYKGYTVKYVHLFDFLFIFLLTVLIAVLVRECKVNKRITQAEPFQAQSLSDVDWAESRGMHCQNQTGVYMCQ